MTMPSPTSGREPLRCGDCGHETYKHRNDGTPVNNIGPDDPVPCWAVTGSREVASRGKNRGSYEYDHCGCTTKHTLAQDAARRRRAESTR